MATANGKARILIVDDHPIVRQGLKLLVANEPDLEVCAESDSMAGAIEEFRRHSPDLVIVDLSLNDGSGIELIKELRALRDDVKILVSSMHDENLYAERVLRAGGMGYINKVTATEGVISAIRHVLSGKIYLSPTMTDRMLCRTVGANDDMRQSSIDTLSDRELEVFQMIGEGLTTRQIAQKLDLSPKTVETYRENIKTKLSLKNGTELTRHAVQWVLEGA